MTKKKSTTPRKSTTVNAEEIRQFERLGSQWWDEKGPM
jgi:2-polyprenyl-3-methyl-5-hydroxy-6-metoxy-1,4-benzoquinol methylase